MKRLIQMDGEMIIRQIPLKKSVYRLGRDKENDVIIDSSKVSRHHAIILESGESYTIIDKDSLGGIYINGERIKKKRLAPGDEITISKDIVFIYTDDLSTAKDLTSLTLSEDLEDSSKVLDRPWETIKKKDFYRLKEVTSRIVSLESLDKILKLILEEAMRLLGAERGFISLTDSKGKVLPETIIKSSDTIENIHECNEEYPHCILKRAVKDRKNVYVSNIYETNNFVSKNISEMGLKAVMAAPLFFGEHPVGILYLDSLNRPFNFQEIEQFFFTFLMDHAIIAIENAKMFEKIQEYNKTLKKEVKESEERYKLLVEISPDAIILLDSEGKISFSNQKALEILKVESKNEIIGKGIIDFIGEGVSENNLVEFLKEIKADEGHVTREVQFTRLDGMPVYVEIVGSGFHFQEQTYILLIGRDITEKKKFEQEIFKAIKLESLGVLAGGIAHDFNNILTAVIGNLSLAKYMDADPDLMEIVNDAEKAALQAKDLTMQLLQFSKGGTLSKESTSLMEMIRDSAIFALRGSRVRCKFDIQEDLNPAEVDKGQINQVINNLIINAVQAMPKGGLINISAKNILIEEDSDIPLKPGKYIQIFVKDQGTGIKPENLEKIFDPYFTTKEKGNGLGLATCYSVIKKHDGHISVESVLGGGTTFYIYLPASDSVVTQQSRGESKTQHRGGGRILMLDDDEFILTVAEKMLKLMGYEIQSAKEGIEALHLYKKAKDSGNPFDLAILDLTVPAGLGGREIVGKILEIDPNALVIASTGYSNDPLINEYDKYGFKGVITKPYKLDELNKSLNRIIECSRKIGVKK